VFQHAVKRAWLARCEAIGVEGMIRPLIVPERHTGDVRRAGGAGNETAPATGRGGPPSLTPETTSYSMAHQRRNPAEAENSTGLPRCFTIPRID
jgi:hypothetical protein